MYLIRFATSSDDLFLIKLVNHPSEIDTVIKNIALSFLVNISSELTQMMISIKVVDHAQKNKEHQLCEMRLEYDNGFRITYHEYYLITIDDHPEIELTYLSNKFNEIVNSPNIESLKKDFITNHCEPYNHLLLFKGDSYIGRNTVILKK